MGMSEENWDQKRKILREVEAGIKPFALEVLKERHANYKSVLRKYRSEDKGNGRSARRQTRNSSDGRTLADEIDVAGWLRLIDKEWPYFQYRLGEADRAYVNLLRLEGRNPASHEIGSNQFTDDEVMHISQSATYLLEAVGAEKRAENTREICEKYIRRLSEHSEETSEKAATANPTQQANRVDYVPETDLETRQSFETAKETMPLQDIEENT